METRVLVLLVLVAVGALIGLYFVVKAAVRDGINESNVARELDQRDA